MTDKARPSASLAIRTAQIRGERWWHLGDVGAALGLDMVTICGGDLALEEALWAAVVGRDIPARWVRAEPPGLTYRTTPSHMPKAPSACSVSPDADLDRDAKSWRSLASTGGDFSLDEAAAALRRDPNIAIGRHRLAQLVRDLRWASEDLVPYGSASRFMVGRVLPGARLQPRITMHGLGALRSELSTRQRTQT